MQFRMTAIGLLTLALLTFQSGCSRKESAGPAKTETGATTTGNVSPYDPGTVPDGSVSFHRPSPAALGPGLRAGPGLVGFIGNPASLVQINPNGSLAGTVFAGVGSWDAGNLLINATDLVVDGYRINAPIVHASGTNFTMRNCVVNAAAGVGFYGISASGTGRGLLTVEDTTVVCASGPGLTVYSAGIISAARLIARRCDVSGSGDGIHMCGIVGSTYADGSIISQCWVHDLSFIDASQHNDGLQVYNTIATNTTTDTWGLIEHCHIDEWHGPGNIAMNAGAIMGKPPGDNTGPNLQIKVDNCLFEAGAYHLRLGLRIVNAVVTNNDVGTLHTDAGEFGLETVEELAGSVAIWSGNVNGDGATVPNPNP